MFKSGWYFIGLRSLKHERSYLHVTERKQYKNVDFTLKLSFFVYYKIKTEYLTVAVL